MKIKDFKIALTLIFVFLVNMILKADDYTLEELKQLRQNSLISQEEYELLAMEIENGSINNERLYTLKIAGKKVSNSFHVMWNNGYKYLSLSDMFNSIGFTNCSSQGSSIIILLGETLDEIKLSGGKAYYKNKEILQKGDYPSYIFSDKKIYMEESVFKELFLLDYRENENRAEIAMELSFAPPASIFKMLDITNQKLSRKSEINEIIYKGKREFFNLGYARFEAGQSFSKYEGSPKYEKDWDGKISYQGGFLYGETRLDYDFRENEFRNFTLDYNDIWKEHDFEIQKSSFTHDGEWSFTFQKNKSYYTVGTQVIITEKVL